MPDSRQFMLGRSLAAAAIVMIVSGVASAQTVGVSVAFDMHRFSGEPGTSVLDATVTGVTVHASAPVAPKMSVAFEAAFEPSTTMTATTDLTQGTVQTDHKSQMRTVSVLAVVHPLERERVRASVLGGMSFVRFERTITIHPTAAVGGSNAESTSTFVDLTGTAIVGGELDFLVSPHVAITPAIRVLALRLASDLSGFSIRPTIGIKWVF